MPLALAIAVGSVRRVPERLYEVQPHDAFTLIAVCSALLTVVLIACAIPARRASAVPPAEALRAE